MGCAALPDPLNDPHRTTESPGHPGRTRRALHSHAEPIGKISIALWKSSQNRPLPRRSAAAPQRTFRGRIDGPPHKLAPRLGKSMKTGELELLHEQADPNHLHYYAIGGLEDMQLPNPAITVTSSYRCICSRPSSGSSFPALVPAELQRSTLAEIQPSGRVKARSFEAVPLEGLDPPRLAACVSRACNQRNLLRLRRVLSWPTTST